jgi:hypothetical protein
MASHSAAFEALAGASVKELERLGSEFRNRELHAVKTQKAVKQGAKAAREIAKAEHAKELAGKRQKAEEERKKRKLEKEAKEEEKQKWKEAKEEAAARKKACGPYNKSRRSDVIKKGMATDGAKKPGPKRKRFPDFVKAYYAAERYHRSQLKKVFDNEMKGERDPRGKRRLTMDDVGEPPSKPPKVAEWERQQKAIKDAKCKGRPIPVFEELKDSDEEMGKKEEEEENSFVLEMVRQREPTIEGQYMCLRKILKGLEMRGLTFLTTKGRTVSRVAVQRTAEIFAEQLHSEEEEDEESSSRGSGAEDDSDDEPAPKAKQSSGSSSSSSSSSS